MDSSGQGRGRGRGSTAVVGGQAGGEQGNAARGRGRGRGVGRTEVEAQMSSLSVNENKQESTTSEETSNQNDESFSSDFSKQKHWKAPGLRIEKTDEAQEKSEKEKKDEERNLKTVFLGDVSPNSTIDSIKAAFAAYGNVFVRIPVDRETGVMKGVAFVEFADEETAKRVLEENRYMTIDNADVRLDSAKSKKKEAPENFQYASSAQRWELPAEGEKASAKDEELERTLFSGESSGINFDKYDYIPCELQGEDIPPNAPIQRFEEADLDPLLLENIELAGYTKPTPIQKYSIPLALANRDIMACAQTGSGKTAAFLFPVLSKLLKRGPYTGPMPELKLDRPSEFKTAFPEVIIMAPTRELVSQIFEEACKFCYRSYLRPCAIYGGADIGSQQYELEKGCSLVVASPGRLIAMIARGSVGLGLVKFLILDEADRMLDMGFGAQINEVIEARGLPDKDSRQTMMFSATFPPLIQNMASSFLKNYIFITVGKVGSTSENITQKVMLVDERDKQDKLISLLKESTGLTLVFLKSKRTADTLDHYLRNEGFACCTIHGDLVQWEREEAIRHFRTGTLPILIATDVASRGLDIPHVTRVINYDIPKEIDDYVHRIGRTGRVGRTGESLSFVNHRDWMIAPTLVNFLQESNQECPDWLIRIANGERKYEDRRGNFQRREYNGGDGENRSFQRREYNGGEGENRSFQRREYNGGDGENRSFQRNNYSQNNEGSGERFNRSEGGGRGGRGGGRGGRGGRGREKEGFLGDNDYSEQFEKPMGGKRAKGEKGEKEASKEFKAWDRMALRDKRFDQGEKVYASTTIV